MTHCARERPRKSDRESDRNPKSKYSEREIISVQIARAKEEKVLLI